MRHWAKGHEAFCWFLTHQNSHQKERLKNAGWQSVQRSSHQIHLALFLLGDSKKPSLGPQHGSRSMTLFAEKPLDELRSENCLGKEPA